MHKHAVIAFFVGWLAALLVPPTFLLSMVKGIGNAG